MSTGSYIQYEKKVRVNRVWYQGSVLSYLTVNAVSNMVSFFGRVKRCSFLGRRCQRSVDGE